MRLSRFVITLPLLFCTTHLFGSLSTAQAANMTATEATAMLAKSQSIDAKCSVLSADQSQQLKDMVARAEITLAEKSGVAVTRKTISAGRAAGKASACDEDSRKLVTDVLAAAGQAVSQAVAETEPVDTPEPEQIENDQAANPAEPEDNALAAIEPEPQPKPAKSAALPKPAKSQSKAKLVKLQKPVKPNKGLGQYASVAEKYYVALRCGNMSSGSINRLYRNVLSNHQQALAANRPADVRAMLRSAEARAGSRSCS